GPGPLWTNATAADWSGFPRPGRRRRASLPTYPFERRSYWSGARPDRGAATPHEPRDTSTWFHRPTWRELPPVAAGIRALGGRRILVFDEETGLGAAVAGGLAAVGAIPVLVTRGEAFARTSPPAFSIHPTQPDRYTHPAADMCAGGSRLPGIGDCCSAAPPGC